MVRIFSIASGCKFASSGTLAVLFKISFCMGSREGQFILDPMKMVVSQNRGTPAIQNDPHFGDPQKNVYIHLISGNSQTQCLGMGGRLQVYDVSMGGHWHADISEAPKPLTTTPPSHSPP